MTKSPVSLKKFAQGLQLDIYPSRLMLAGIATVVLLMFVSVLLLDIPYGLKFVFCSMTAFYGWFINSNYNPGFSNLKISTSRTCYISIGIHNVDPGNKNYTCASNITGWRLLLPWLVIVHCKTTAGKRLNIPVFHDSVKDDEFRRLAVMLKTG